MKKFYFGFLASTLLTSASLLQIDAAQAASRGCKHLLPSSLRVLQLKAFKSGKAFDKKLLQRIKRAGKCAAVSASATTPTLKEIRIFDANTDLLRGTIKVDRANLQATLPDAIKDHVALEFVLSSQIASGIDVTMGSMHRREVNFRYAFPAGNSGDDFFAGRLNHTMYPLDVNVCGTTGAKSCQNAVKIFSGTLTFESDSASPAEINTPTPTATATNTKTPIVEITATKTPTPTATATKTKTPVVEISPTRTPTPTPTNTSTPITNPPQVRGELANALGRHGMDFGMTVTSSRVNRTDVQTQKYLKTVIDEASMIGAENDFKPCFFLPSEAKGGKKFDPMSQSSIAAAMNYAGADAVANFARAHGLRVHSHTLLWAHRCLAGDGAPWYWNAAQAEAFLKNYIPLVVNRYKDVVDTIDVVNEVGDGANGYRDGPFFNLLGSRFMDIAFKAARDADPHAKLYWNDYVSLGSVCKQAKILKARGVQIDGIASQGHQTVESASDTGSDLTAADFKCGADAGLDVAISEFDMGIRLAAPGDTLRAQALAGKASVLACINGGGARCKAFRQWGVFDGQSIVNNANYGKPLLFDQQFNRKLIYQMIKDAL